MRLEAGEVDHGSSHYCLSCIELNGARGIKKAMAKQR